MKKYICSMEIFNFNFKPTLLNEVTGRNKWQKNRGKTALKSHYQYIRQLDFIQNNFTMFNPLAVQPVMLE